MEALVEGCAAGIEQAGGGYSHIDLEQRIMLDHPMRAQGTDGHGSGEAVRLFTTLY